MVGNSYQSVVADGAVNTISEGLIVAQTGLSALIYQCTMKKVQVLNLFALQLLSGWAFCLLARQISQALNLAELSTELSRPGKLYLGHPSPMGFTIGDTCS